MKILGLSGGTPNGSNDAMCKEALMGAQECGAEVEFINLNQLEIKRNNIYALFGDCPTWAVQAG